MISLGRAFFEYVYTLPLGMLASVRKHIVKPLDANRTKYDSIFILKGWLSPVVRLFAGKCLKRGFSNMTDGIADRSVDIHRQLNRQ